MRGAGEGREFGAFGDDRGGPHDHRLIAADGGGERILETKEVGIIIGPGDTLLVESAGGGGYGDPKERSAQARARDCADELTDD